MDWLKEKLEKIWEDKEVEQPNKKTSWRLRSGITLISRRVKSNRRHQAVVNKEGKTAEEIWNDFSEFGKCDDE